MDAQVLENCIGPLSKAYLSRLPHHVVPCHNLHRVVDSLDEVDDVADLLEEPFPYSSTAPAPLIPLVPATRKVLNGHDPTKTLVKEKMKWQTRKERLTKAARKDKNSISGKAIKRAVREPVGSKVVVPRGVALLAQHLDNDPDPYFAGSYNWYYTGGRLATLTHRNDQFLLHGNKSNLHYTKVVSHDQADSGSIVELSPNDPVYQVVSNSTGVVVRQRMNINILSVSEDSDGRLDLTKVMHIPAKSHPFLSVALPSSSIQQFCSITNNGILKLWDLEYSRKRQMIRLRMEPGEGITVSDSWRTLLYVDPNTLLLADRCCVHVLDVRAGMQEKQLSWCPQKLTEQCEELSHVVTSRARDRSVYLLTSHQAFSLDLRYGFTQRWTHMMASPPIYGFTHSVDNEGEEVLCMGSVVPSDCVAVVNSWSEKESHSRWRPGGLPSPALGLHLARTAGTCLHPSLMQRCSQNTTGLTCLPSEAEGSLNVVRQSATADVFIQQLTRQRSDSDTKQLTDRQLAAYTEWCRPTLSWKGDQTSLRVSKVTNLSGLFQALVNGEEERLPERVPVDTGKAWRLSRQYLGSCVDMLASRMLAVWGVEDEDEWETEEEEEEQEEQDVGQKVLNWLGAARNTTDMSLMKPTVTSTPFPKVTGSVPGEVQETDRSLGCEPLTQQTSLSKTELTTEALTTPTRTKKPTSTHLLPSSSSNGSPESERKKLKMSQEKSAAKPTSKSLTASAKKKFVPGF